jgi:hypothetical protein
MWGRSPTTQSTDILKFELSKFRLKNSPCIFVANFVAWKSDFKIKQLFEIQGEQGLS